MPEHRGMWDLSSSTRDQTHGPCIESAESLPPDHRESLKTSNSLQISDSWLLTRYQSCHFVSSLEQEVKTGGNWRSLFMDEWGIRNLFHEIPRSPPNPGSSSSSHLDWQSCFCHVTTPIRLFLALLSDCCMKQIPALPVILASPTRRPHTSLLWFPPLPFLHMSSWCPCSNPSYLHSTKFSSSNPHLPTSSRSASLPLPQQTLCPRALNSLGPERISSGAHGPRPRYLFMTLDRWQGPRAFSLLFSVLAKPGTFACPEWLPESRFSELNWSSVLRQVYLVQQENWVWDAQTHCLVCLISLSSQTLSFLLHMHLFVGTLGNEL